MDSGLLTELVKLGAGGLVAALVLVLGTPAFVTVWKLWRTAESARNSEARTAAEALFEQRILNVEARGTIERRDETIAELRRDLDRCERDRDHWRGWTPPQPEASG